MDQLLNLLGYCLNDRVSPPGRSSVSSLPLLPFRPRTAIFPPKIEVGVDKYEGRLISNAHSEIFCQWSKVAMRAQCVLVATTLLHNGAKFHSFLYTGSKTVRVNM